MTFGRTDGRACVCGGRARGDATPRPRRNLVARNARVVGPRRVCKVPLGPPYTMN